MPNLHERPLPSFAEIATALGEFAFAEADTGDKAEAFVAGLEIPSVTMERVVASMRHRTAMLAAGRQLMRELAEHEPAVRRMLARLAARERRRKAVSDATARMKHVIRLFL